MGIDFYDLIFRLEKRFGIELERVSDSRWKEIFLTRNPPDITAGELYEVVIQKIQEQGREMPANGWAMFCFEVSRCLGVHESDIKPESLLAGELGMS